MMDSAMRPAENNKDKFNLEEMNKSIQDSEEGEGSSQKMKRNIKSFHFTPF